MMSKAKTNHLKQNLLSAVEKCRDVAEYLWLKKVIDQGKDSMSKGFCYEEYEMSDFGAPVGPRVAKNFNLKVGDRIGKMHFGMGKGNKGNKKKDEAVKGEEVEGKEKEEEMEKKEMKNKETPGMETWGMQDIGDAILMADIKAPELV
jgi:hypothetical protein